MLFSGCTAIGIGIGAVVDHHHARPRQATWENAQKIPRGSFVRVTLTSDSTLRGEFIGWRTLPTGRQFVVQSEGRTTAVPLAQIRDIFAMPRRSHYWILGGFVGLAVDAAVVATMVHNLEHEGLVNIGAY